MSAITDFIMKSGKNYDLGLLILRIGFGINMALFHGWAKISGGPERWEGIGGSMANLGITFFPTVWGFMAGFSEFFSSIFLMLVFFFRPATTLLGITMFVSAVRHLRLPPEAANSGFSGASHAIDVMTLCIALYLAGPGKFSIMKPSED